MNRKLNWNRIAQAAVVLLVALALKQFYSTASANQLRWILAPTTLLVHLASGESFQFEAYAGYITSDHGFVIAAACAGVNFLITSFVMLALGKLWRDRSEAVSWSFIPKAAVVAFATTLLANTVRIVIALQLQRTPPDIDGLSSGELHRLEGILVYFGFLLLLFVASDRGNGKKTSRLFSLALFPLLIYYATTLGIPLANSAYRQRFNSGDFGEHFVFVLLTPLVLILPLVAFRFYKIRFGAKSTNPRSGQLVAQLAQSLRPALHWDRGRPARTERRRREQVSFH
jgi:exosortase K